MPEGSKARIVAPAAASGGSTESERRVAHVVGLRLEGEAEHRDRLARHAAAQAATTRSAIAALRASFTATVVSTRRSGLPASCAVRASARVSLGKHDPP